MAIILLMEAELGSLVYLHVGSLPAFNHLLKRSSELSAIVSITVVITSAAKMAVAVRLLF